MAHPIDKKYYIDRKAELIKKFEENLRQCSPFIFAPYGEINAFRIIQETRKTFEELIPQIPYIGGDENNLTRNLIASVSSLALYQAMKKHGKTAEETGKVLYNAILTQIGKPRLSIQPHEILTPEQLDERRKKDAERSQERRYPDDFVYTYIVGNGKKFDHGYDFTKCAVLEFYHSQDADEFMPFFCYLDFPINKVNGTGFSRTMTISEGAEKCNHRIKIGGETKVEWPPPFLKRKKK